MTASSESPPPAGPGRAAPPRKTAADERAERLAAQLRANLRRRKDQVRGRDAAEPASPDDEGGDER